MTQIKPGRFLTKRQNTMLWANLYQDIEEFINDPDNRPSDVPLALTNRLIKTVDESLFLATAMAGVLKKLEEEDNGK